MKLVAHRGKYNKDIKENTYESIKYALNDNKYVGVEFDIRCTKDNVFIVYHDVTYNNKLISNTLYNELPRYIPKLEDILNIISNKIFLIEIKNINNRYDKFIKLINKYNNKKIYIMSFSNNIINKLNISNRFYKIGILNYIFNNNELINNLDFVAILNSLLSLKNLDILKNKEIFSYGLLNNHDYKDVYYIE